MIRRAAPADRPVVRALQRLLPERAPDLLDHALARGDVLVSVGAPTAAGAFDPSDGDDLAVSGSNSSADGSDSAVGGSDPSAAAVDPLPLEADLAAAGSAFGSPADGVDAPGLPVGYLLPVHGEEIHVAELVVAPDRRREGRATALLDALFASLPAGRRVTLAVAPDNDAALSLYREYGFAVDERREGYFESGPALLLSRVVAGD